MYCSQRVPLLPPCINLLTSGGPKIAPGGSQAKFLSLSKSFTKWESEGEYFIDSPGDNRKF